MRQAVAYTITMLDKEIIELTLFQKRASKVAALVSIFLAALFLLLTGIIAAMPNLISVLAITIVSMFALLFLACGIIQKNSVSTWIAIVFMVAILIEALTLSRVATYAQIYPLYIAAPFIASLFVGIICRNLQPHLMPMLLFSGLSALFFIQSSGLGNRIDGLGGWAFVLPLASALVIGFIVYAVYNITHSTKS